MEAPFARRQDVIGVGRIPIHHHHMFRLDLVVGYAGRRNEKTVTAWDTDVAGRSFAEAQMAHAQAGFEQFGTQFEFF